MFRYVLLAVMIALGATAASVGAGAVSDEERKKTCDKAEKRYQKLFGMASADEDVVIVKMYKYTFCPGSIEVKQGATVRWVNVDRRTSHSTWFKEAGEPESDRLFSEEKVEMTFDLPAGIYPYLCGPHWKEEGMIGKVTVVE